MKILPYLSEMVALKAADLFLTVNLEPTIKLNGEIQKLPYPKLSSDEIKQIIQEILTDKQKIDFEENFELNFAIQVPNLGRFRVNLFKQCGKSGAVIRHVSAKVPSLDNLKMPNSIKDLIKYKDGLILVVGPTGSGKSTTLAALINEINITAHRHIICLEDPIEYVHQGMNSIINQREVGVDTVSYEVGLRNALRQAPDVVLIGEIRTAETMQLALSFARTGHLCLASLHANNANQTIERISNFFSKEEVKALQFDLASNLRAVIAQQLIPGKLAHERKLATEILINTPTIADCLMQDKKELIKEYMTKSISQGMRTFDQSLFQMWQDQEISEESALKYSDSENNMRLQIKLTSHKKNDQVSNFEIKK